MTASGTDHAPAAVFELLGHETRSSIIEALWEAHRISQPFEESSSWYPRRQLRFVNDLAKCNWCPVEFVVMFDLSAIAQDILYKDGECTGTQMASKTISIKESTYDRLKALKGPDESFSDAIDRLVGVREGQHPLFDIVGLLDEHELAQVRERSHAFRSDLDERMGMEE